MSSTKPTPYRGHKVHDLQAISGHAVTRSFAKNPAVINIRTGNALDRRIPQSFPLQSGQVIK